MTTPCIDCEKADPMPGMLRCEACGEVAMLLQARAILQGADIPVTVDHLRAMASVVNSQASTIAELQQVVTGHERELPLGEAADALANAFQKRLWR